MIKKKSKQLDYKKEGVLMNPEELQVINESVPINFNNDNETSEKEDKEDNK